MSYCRWDCTSEENRRYHDEEWGVPLHDDRGQFEFQSMEVMQCGLSWGLIIRKRSILNTCFDGFDYDRVAAYGEEDIERILQAEGMIRARRKIEAIITNAQAFQKVRGEFGTFSDYLWSFTDGKSVVFHKHPDGWIPASNGLSEKISKDLKRRGFKFVGPVVIYSHLQACGIINDHDRDCPCYRKLVETAPTVYRRRYLEKEIRFYG